MGRCISITNAALVLALALFTGLPSASTDAQVIYTEDFTDFAATNWSNGYCEVKWCPTPEAYSGASCGNANTMREYGSTDDDYIWVHFGTRGCSSVTISFSYTQWEGYPPNPNNADTNLKYKISTSDTMSCPPSGMTQALLLNKTYSSTVTCYPATYTVNVTSSDRSAYFMFDKGTFPNQFLVDNVQISLGGCICGPGACITNLSQNFGNTFQSGTVCALFPGTFESCTGAGPYISSGTTCGGTGDEVMSFGSGYPYSQATLRCLNLAGLTQASLRFNLSKTDSTLGPALYAGLDQTNWTNIWTAPFIWGGGCSPVCIDLSAYAGQAQVWLKFSSETTSPSHGIDDLLLVRGTACPPPTGSCCLADGTCTVTTEAACAGTWTLNGTCTPNNCPLPTGSCCHPDGTCAVTLQAACADTWTMFGVCEPNTCQQPTGSCCHPDGTCSVTLQAACTDAWTMSGVCEPNTCQQPTGSCCYLDGTCAATSQATCVGVWTLSGTCEPNPCACPLMGDINTDNVIDGLDITGFVDCVLYPTVATNCRCGNFDHNNVVDLDDVSEFVTALLP